MKKRLFSLFTALALCLTLLPTAALAADEPITLTNGNLSDYVDANDGHLSTAHSSYRLGEDIELPKYALLIVGNDPVPQPNITLDLNGHVLSRDTQGLRSQVISVQTGATLTLTDSSAGKADAPAHYFTVAENGQWVWDKTAASQPTEGRTVIGGCIVGGVHRGVGIYSPYADQPACFVMESGSIVGGSTSTGSNCGGVNVNNRARFTMNGGSILGCRAEGDGGGVYVSSCCSFTMTGGEISDCVADGHGGGVSAYKSSSDSSNDGKITIKGSGSTVKISGNTLADGTAENVYLRKGFVMTLQNTDQLGSGSAVGLTVEEGSGGTAAFTYDKDYACIKIDKAGYVIATTFGGKGLLTPIQYDIAFELNGGVCEELAGGWQYSVEDAACTLPQPTREGWEFAGWGGTGLTGTNNRNVTIPKGSTGDRTYTAYWTHPHQEGDLVWKTDATQHWLYCPTCEYTGTRSSHSVGADGKCTTCQTQFAATIGTGVYSYYETVSAALAAASGLSPTITLIADVTETTPISMNKAALLDLNGHTLTADLTVSLGDIGRVALTDSSTGKNGALAGTLTMQSGRLGVSGGAVQALVHTGGTVSLSGGSFGSITTTGAVSALLAAGSAYYDTNGGGAVSASALGESTLSNVRVAACKHESVNGNNRCTVCQQAMAASITRGTSTLYFADIDSALESLADGDVLKLLADVSTRGVTLTGKITLDLNENSWRTLLTSDPITVGKGASLTVKSSRGTGGIKHYGNLAALVNVEGSLTVEGGQAPSELNINQIVVKKGGTATLKTCSTYGVQNENGPVTALLAEGMAFWVDEGTSGRKWMSDNSDVTDIDGNVAVADAPIKAASISGANALTCGYATAAVTVTTVRSEMYSGEQYENSTESYQWYFSSSLTDLYTDAKKCGTNAASLTLPTGLSAGTYYAGCTVTLPDADGYARNAEPFTVTVSQGTMAESSYPKAWTGLYYKAAAWQLIRAGTAPAGATLYYSLDGSIWTTNAADITATDAGTYPVYWKLDGGGNYADVTPAEPLSVTIEPLDLAKQEEANYAIKVSGTVGSAGTFNGSGQEPTLTLTYTDFDDEGNDVSGSLTAGTDYTVSYSVPTGSTGSLTADRKPLNAGTYTVTATGKGNYKGTLTFTWTIGKAAAPTLDDIEVEVLYSANSFEVGQLGRTMPTNAGTLRYFGPVKLSDIMHTGAVQVYAAVLNEENTELGGFFGSGTVGDTITVPVTVTSTNYQDAAVKVVITLTDKTAAPLTVTMSDRTYGDAAAAPSYATAQDMTKLSVVYKVKDAADSTYSTAAPADAGSYTVRVSYETATEKRSGTADFTIRPKALTAAMISAADDLTYNGAAQRPTVTVTDNGKALQANTDYTVAVTAQSAAGSYHLSVSGQGNYGGTVSDVAWRIRAAALSGVSAAQSGTLTYNGQPQTAAVQTAATAVGGRTVTFTYSTTENGTYTAAVPAFTSGTHTVYYKAEADSHTAASGSFAVTIGKAAVTVRAADRNAYEDDAAPDLSAPVMGTDYTAKGLIGTDTVAVKLTCAADMSKAGEYAIVPSVEGEDDRYAFTFENGTLTVSARPSSDDDDGYAVSITKPAHGTVRVTPRTAERNDTVTVTVTPDKGYTLETLTVTDRSGKALKLTEKGGKYTFKMPASRVTVTATFMEDNTMLNFFVDVPAEAYYYDAVLWAVENGITGGVDELHFAPDRPCTRAQIVTFLWRAAGSPEPENAGGFTDVSGDAYYAKAVAWAVENGITGGMGDGSFAPNATCTRAQAVAFLFRYAALNGMDFVTLQELVSGYGDASGVPGYALSAFNWALAGGVVTGSSGSLMPNNSCTRAQIVTMLYRLLGR